jgi:[acyl-carrier-protein] S-malonyltransferase
MTLAFVFPGQGSQTVGMGKSLAEASPLARDIFNEVDDALGEKLSALMFDGDADTLNLTENAQPALMAVSVATARVFLETLGRPVQNVAAFVAGHSLGEYSALVVNGCLSVSDAAHLLRRRGQAMQRAVPVGEGAMAAILNLSIDEVEAIAASAQQGEVCETANDNAPGQVVVSGHKAAVERAMALAAEKGAKRSIMLPVSAPFHCSLMAPAARAMADALAQIDLGPPMVPVVPNVTASAITDPPELRRLLVEQVTARVRWRESVLFMRAAGVDRFVEFGAGKVLTGLARRIDKGASALSLGTMEDIAAFAAEME